MTTTTVTERGVPVRMILAGSLAADRSAEVAASGSGRVIATSVERGDFVKKGAAIVRLDARAARLGRAEATAQVTSAEVQKQNAALECERAERLFAERVISRADYDRMHASCGSANAQADAAIARRGLADKSLSDSVVRAPFSGLVVERSVTVGEFVTPGMGVVTLVDIDPLRLEVSVPESAVRFVGLGKKLDFTVAAFPEQTFSATVKFVSPAIRLETRALMVEAVVDNAAGDLRPGMFATARLAVGEEKLPSVPEQAITGAKGSPRVFVVKDGRVEERIVREGDRDSGRVAIVSGLRPGETVVVGPGGDVKDGALVR